MRNEIVAQYQTAKISNVLRLV